MERRQLRSGFNTDWFDFGDRKYCWISGELFVMSRRRCRPEYRNVLVGPNPLNVEWAMENVQWFVNSVHGGGSMDHDDFSHHSDRDRSQVDRR